MNETWYAEQHPDGDWRVFDRGTGTHGRDRLVAEDLTESDAKRISADHNASSSTEGRANVSEAEATPILAKTVIEWQMEVEVEREATRQQRVKAQFQFERANDLEAQLTAKEQQLAEAKKLLSNAAWIIPQVHITYKEIKEFLTPTTQGTTEGERA